MDQVGAAESQLRATKAGSACSLGIPGHRWRRKWVGSRFWLCVWETGRKIREFQIPQMSECRGSKDWSRSDVSQEAGGEGRRAGDACRRAWVTVRRCRGGPRLHQPFSQCLPNTVASFLLGLPGLPRAVALMDWDMGSTNHVCLLNRDCNLGSCFILRWAEKTWDALVMVRMQRLRFA